MRLRLSAAILIGFFLSVCASTPVLAQPDTLVTATARAKILSPVSVQSTNTLKFGKMGTTMPSGSVTIDPQFDTRSYTASVQVDGAVSFHAASFSVTGEPGLSFSVSLPTSTTMNGMTVNTFTKYPTTHQLDANGNATFKVGAKLNLPANKAALTYENTISVTVAYN